MSVSTDSVIIKAVEWKHQETVRDGGPAAVLEEGDILGMVEGNCAPVFWVVDSCPVVGDPIFGEGAEDEEDLDR